MMFPIRINVLSASKKKHLRHLTLFTYIKSACAVVFALLGILASLLLIVQKFFIDYQNAFSYHTVGTPSSYHDDVKKIESTNNTLKKVDAVQQGFVLWSPRIDTIIHALPNGVIVHSISFDHEYDRFSLVGVADTRQTLETTEKKLSELPLLESIVIPPGDLTQREQISFTVEATLTK